MATSRRELLQTGGNTDPEIDNNIRALTGDGIFKGVIVTEQTLDAASVADAAQGTEALTVKGVKLGDAVMAVSFGVDVEGLTVTAHVDAADSVEIVLDNNTGGAVDLASTTVRLVIFTT